MKVATNFIVKQNEVVQIILLLLLLLFELKVVWLAMSVTNKETLTIQLCRTMCLRS